jgi:hypothetical protein
MIIIEIKNRHPFTILLFPEINHGFSFDIVKPMKTTGCILFGGSPVTTSIKTAKNNIVRARIRE